MRRSGLVSRKASAAGPAILAAKLRIWGRYAALSRHKAAPTPTALYLGFSSRRSAAWQSPDYAE
ncbi:hypothetical protein FW789_21660 [Pseudomonas sp. 1121_17]